jgi:MFS family permease
MSLQLGKEQPATPQAQEEKVTKAVIVQLLLLGIGLTFYTLNRYAFPIGLNDIGKAFHFTLVQALTLGTVFLLGQAIIDIPAGYMTDKLNRRFLFFISMFGIGAMVIAFMVFTTGYTSALLWRVAFGLAEGIFCVSAFSLVGALLPSRRGFLVSLTQIFVGIGAFGGPITFGLLNRSSGSWQYPLTIFAIATMVYAFILLAFLRVENKDLPALAKIRTPAGETFFSALRAVTRLPSMWAALVIPCFNTMALWGLNGVGATS